MACPRSIVLPLFRRVRFFLTCVAALLLCAECLAQKSSELKVDPQLLQGLHWRSIGPAVFGGRVTDVSGVPDNPNIIYVAHSSAGLFK
jgi:hypothetical protein